MHKVYTRRQAWLRCRARRVQLKVQSFGSSSSQRFQEQPQEHQQPQPRRPCGDGEAAAPPSQGSRRVKFSTATVFTVEPLLHHEDLWWSSHELARFRLDAQRAMLAHRTRQRLHEREPLWQDCSDDSSGDGSASCFAQESATLAPLHMVIASASG